MSDATSVRILELLKLEGERLINEADAAGTLEDARWMFTKLIEARTLLSLYRTRHCVDGRGYRYDKTQREELDTLIAIFESEVSSG